MSYILEVVMKKKELTEKEIDLLWDPNTDLEVVVKIVMKGVRK